MSRLPSRAGVYGGWWAGSGAGVGGLGQSGETDTEGSGLPTDLAIDPSSWEFDPSKFYLDPGFNITTTPGVELSPTELAAEQDRARSWLQSLPNTINTGSKLALTAQQILQGVAVGAIHPSSTCPSGYLLANGQCVQKAGGTGTTGQLIPGLDNKTLLLLGAGVLFLMMISSSGGRRR